MISVPWERLQPRIDPPYITPVAPVAGETVSVNIRYGVCDAIRVVQSIAQDGHAIRVLLSAIRYTGPFMCNFPPDDLGVYPVGAYPPGSHTLQVDIIYVGSAGQHVTETLATLSFTVTAAPAPAVPAPVNGHVALAFLMFVLLGLAAWRLRTSGSPWLFIVIMGAPLGLRARDVPNNAVVEVLLAAVPGAPTPEQLVSYFDRSPRSGPLPLQSLSVGNPSDVQYLMPVRAEGDFLAWLQANLDSPRTQLENHVIVVYPQGTDTTRPLAALRSDPYVAAAYVPPPSWLSSVSLVDFEVDGPAQPQGGGQYGRTDLDIDAAWQIAGGWALVAEIDMGLDPSHPALRQFDGLAEPRAITSTVDGGTQVISMSFGLGDPVCANNPTPPLCLAIQYAADHDTAMVAASGNNRTDLQYPVSDSAHVISAGGFDENLALWDESPGLPVNTTHCPVGAGHPPGTKCGSDWTALTPTPAVSYDHQELMASAKHVLSTTYPNFDYQAYAECGDSYGTPIGDGIGWCTGTSMSAPQIAGVVGILRSINPLTPTGTPYGAAGTVRKILATTTYEAQAGHTWERH